MTDANHYLMYHLDVYHDKYKANIKTQPSLYNVPTAQKTMANTIVKYDIANTLEVSRHIFMNSLH